MFDALPASQRNIRVADGLPVARCSRIAEDGRGRVRTVLGVETQAETPCAGDSHGPNSQRLCVGEPWTYVQASRLKVHGTACFCRFSNSPTRVLQGLFAGAHRRRFPPEPRIGGVCFPCPFRSFCMVVITTAVSCVQPSSSCLSIGHPSLGGLSYA